MKAITHVNRHVQLVGGYKIRASDNEEVALFIDGGQVGLFMLRNTVFSMPRSSEIISCLTACLKDTLGVREEESEISRWLRVQRDMWRIPSELLD